MHIGKFIRNGTRFWMVPLLLFIILPASRTRGDDRPLRSLHNSEIPRWTGTAEGAVLDGNPLRRSGVSLIVFPEGGRERPPTGGVRFPNRWGGS